VLIAFLVPCFFYYFIFRRTWHGTFVLNACCAMCRFLIKKAKINSHFRYCICFSLILWKIVSTMIYSSHCCCEQGLTKRLRHLPQFRCFRRYCYHDAIQHFFLFWVNFAYGKQIAILTWKSGKIWYGYFETLMPAEYLSLETARKNTVENIG